ncbi:hypothetical protein GGX14DRAFT_557123 [Mycena pura]|uniref:Uncharacterized protein n=1 Tax=Mycena pura TaxID=153505 RepID=A0AAD6YN37_9AGAR|nr:hypothetical protein GGX14DRAFT_557123 [Mycena pura]
MMMTRFGNLIRRLTSADPGIDGLGSGGCEIFFGPPRGVCRTPLIAKFTIRTSPRLRARCCCPCRRYPRHGARGMPRNYTVWNALPAGLSIGGAALNKKVVVGGPATKNQAAYVPLCPRDNRLRPRARRRRGLIKYSDATKASSSRTARKVSSKTKRVAGSSSTRDAQAQIVRGDQDRETSPQTISSDPVVDSATPAIANRTRAKTKVADIKSDTEELPSHTVVDRNVTADREEGGKILDLLECMEEMTERPILEDGTLNIRIKNGMTRKNKIIEEGGNERHLQLPRILTTLLMMGATPTVRSQVADPLEEVSQDAGQIGHRTDLPLEEEAVAAATVVVEAIRMNQAVAEDLQIPAFPT